MLPEAQWMREGAKAPISMQPCRIPSSCGAGVFPRIYLCGGELIELISESLFSLFSWLLTSIIVIYDALHHITLYYCSFEPSTGGGKSPFDRRLQFQYHRLRFSLVGGFSWRKRIGCWRCWPWCWRWPAPPPRPTPRPTWTPRWRRGLALL